MSIPGPDERPRVLIVDDEKFIRDILADFLGMEGYIVRTAEDGSAALAELHNAHYDLIISDLKMPRMGGIELLDAIGTAAPSALTVIMTGFGTVETAIDAMKRGAYDYILKPFKVEEVIRVVQRGLEKQRLAAENLRLREALSLYKVSEAIAASLSLEEVLATIGDTALFELQGDFVSTWLDDGEGGYFERQRLSQSPEPPPGSVRGVAPGVPTLSTTAPGPDYGVIAPNLFIEYYAAHSGLLEHGAKASRFFSARAPGRVTRLRSSSDEDATSRMDCGCELYEAKAVQRRASEATVDRRLTCGCRNRECAPLRRSPRDVPADDRGAGACDRQDGPVHGRALGARRDVCNLSCRAAGVAAGHGRGRASERVDARHRQNRLRDELEQAGQADARRVRGIQAAPRVRQRHSRPDPVSASARPGGPFASRAVGRSRLSPGSPRPRCSPDCTDHRGSRHLRRDDQRSSVPPSAPARSRPR